VAVSWRADELLWLLTLVPVFAGLAVLAWWLRRRITRRFGEPAIVRDLVAGRSGPWRAVRGVLFVLALTLTILALAGPQYGSRTRTLNKRGIDVVLALDFSESMLARDVKPNRIERAKGEISRFLEELAGDRLGLVAFAGDTMEFPMTVDYSAIRLFLRDLGPKDMPVGGTALGRALIASKRLLERSERDTKQLDPKERPSRVVLLLTDGEDHQGQPLKAARKLAKAGIKVYTVGIGSRTGEPIPTYSDDGTWTGYKRNDEGEVITTALTSEHEKQLRKIADLTGGKYFRADKGSVGVGKIRAEMRRMKQVQRESRQVTVHEDRYALVLLPAFLFAVLEALLPDAWLGRRRRREEAA
jgi:Ca-activated chloride channel family protein